MDGMGSMRWRSWMGWDGMDGKEEGWIGWIQETGPWMQDPGCMVQVPGARIQEKCMHASVYDGMGGMNEMYGMVGNDTIAWMGWK